MASAFDDVNIMDLTTPFGHASFCRIYPTKDGWVQIAAGNITFIRKLFLAMGQEVLISDPRFENLPWALTIEESRALAEIIGDLAKQYTSRLATANWV